MNGHGNPRPRCSRCGDLLDDHAGPKCLKCPCGSNAITPDLAADKQWQSEIQAERSRQVEKGYTAAHDAEHGVDHLLGWAQDFARRGEPVKSAALIEAARELLAAEYRIEAGK